MNRFASLLLLCAPLLLTACPDKFCDHNDECISGYLCNQQRRCIEAEPFQLLTQTLPDAFVAQAYQVSLLAQGGLKDYTWSLTTDQAWLSLSPAGTLSGTPPNPLDSASIQISVQDNSHPDGLRITKTYPFTIHPCDCPTPSQPCRTNLCTAPTTCEETLLADGTPCDDGLFCTINDTCNAGVCQSTEPRNCDNLADCDQGICNETEATCTCAPDCDPNPCTEPHRTVCSIGQDGQPECSCDEGYEPNEQDECVRYEYQCTSDACGADLQRRTCIDKCEEWTTHLDCAATDLCQANTESPGCITCEVDCHNGKCTVCSPGSGPCCSNAGSIEPAEVICDEWSEYRCIDTGCGADSQHRVVKKYCNGHTTSCEGGQTDPVWLPHQACNDDQKCVSDGHYADCTTCEHGCENGKCLDCTDGICCEPDRHFSSNKVICANWNEYRCSDTDCGADPQYRERVQRCSGGSAECDGVIQTPTSWTTSEFCPADQSCLQVGNDPAECYACQENSTCINGSCECDFVNCGKNCCPEGEICRFDGVCGFEIQLSPSDNAEPFGTAVAIDGSTIFVGAPLAIGGRVYVFEYDGASWKETQQLTPSDSEAGDNFGISVGISGDYAIAGSTGHGTAYIFEKVGGIWTEVKIVNGEGPAEPHSTFGRVVSIHGPRCLVGGDSSYGPVVLHRETANWIVKNEWSSSAWSGSHNSWSICISDSFAFVGRPGAGDNAENGETNIWQRQEEHWTFVDTLLPSEDVQEGNFFGGAIAATDQFAIIGAPTGMLAYIFEQAGNVWSLTKTVPYPSSLSTHPHEVSYRSILAGDGTYAMIGYPLASGGGKVVSYTKEPNNWATSVAVTASESDSNAQYGCSISFDGQKLLVGACGANKAFVY